MYGGVSKKSFPLAAWRPPKFGGATSSILEKPRKRYLVNKHIGTTAAMLMAALVSITIWWLPRQILAGRQVAEGKDFLDTPPYPGGIALVEYFLFIIGVMDPKSRFSAGAGF